MKHFIKNLIYNPYSLRIRNSFIVLALTIITISVFLLLYGVIIYSVVTNKSTLSSLTMLINGLTGLFTTMVTTIIGIYTYKKTKPDINKNDGGEIDE
jgi:uncharacterized membrane protein